jgi:hypothetical protein
VTWVAITARCEIEDLESPGLRPIVTQIKDKLRELRTQAPEDGERVGSLRDRDCLSLHGSRYRGVTWYDRERDVVWLLSVGIHRDDSHVDAYAVAAALERAGRLYPTDADIAIAERDFGDTRHFATLKSEAAALRELRDEILRTQTGATHSYTSENDLYAELWVESIPSLALLLLRLRIYRRSTLALGDADVAFFVKSIFADIVLDEPMLVPDSDGRFRCFEGYVTPLRAKAK